MSERTRLLNRRWSQTLDLEVDVHLYAVSIAFDDAAIVISHHLQLGGTAEQLRRSMSRERVQTTAC